MTILIERLVGSDFIIPDFNKFKPYELIVLNNNNLIKSIKIMYKLNDKQLNAFRPLLFFIVNLIRILPSYLLSALVNVTVFQTFLSTVVNVLLNSINTKSLANLSILLSQPIPGIPTIPTLFPPRLPVIYSDFFIRNIIPSPNDMLNQCIQLLLPLTNLQLIVLYPLFLTFINLIINLNYIGLTALSSFEFTSLLLNILNFLKQLLSGLSVNDFTNIITTLSNQLENLNF